uniref:Uncharacterized protein n=1 Tax=Tanacetum cinerariifolium TaxID=118510 RepID=A0A699KPK0_TANCI|nr:hypothetical protein [Tanacetum cinerariifolium]
MFAATTPIHIASISGHTNLRPPSPPPHLAVTTTPPQPLSLPPRYHHPPNRRLHVTAVNTIVTFDSRHLHLHHIHHLLLVNNSEPPPPLPRPPCHHLKGAFGFAYNSTMMVRLGWQKQQLGCVWF